MKRILKQVLVGLLLLVFLGGKAEGHGTAVPAIIDTDVALDDMRALAMLFNSGATDVCLLVASDGALAPPSGARKLQEFLRYVDREDITIAVGKNLKKSPPPWRERLEDVQLTGVENKSEAKPDFPPAPAKISETLRSAGSGILYICLGPLTSLAAAIEADPAVKANISWLIYFGDHPNASSPGWNTSWDPDSARAVFDSGIRIHAFCLSDNDLLAFDQSLYEEIKGIGTSTADLIITMHDGPAIKKLLAEGHFRVWDEMVAVYLNHPALFTFRPSSEQSGLMKLAAFEREKLGSAYLSLIGNPADMHLTSRPSVVLQEFPRDPALFQADVAPHVLKIVEEHGLEEWKACLLTNELHRHLGIYSLVGAKMGIRARELLEAPFDTLEVLSFAGNDPPLSCLNDGLQVATGASLGRGTIQIADGEPFPAALFSSKNASLRLTLKADWQAKITKDVARGTKKYGTLSPEYFAFIRKLSIQYWLNLDRTAIFEETME